MYKFAKLWYQPKLTFLCRLLLPASWLYRIILSVRHRLYQHKIFKTSSFSCPIIVVGNITVGGTGKTPFVIYLAEFLKCHGWNPGIVSRGVGGAHASQPISVVHSSIVNDVGDEALLLRQRTTCPIMVCANRSKAVNALLASTNCNVVISDDGLQHYSMHRDIEIVMVDGKRQFGNQQLLPAGPLREPLTRLNHVDFKIVKNNTLQGYFSMQTHGSHFVSMTNPELQVSANFFHAQKVHAVAGISDPENFFQSLEKLGLSIIRHEFADHYQFQASDMNFNDDNPVIMTEKDMVKCKRWANSKFWYLPIDATMDKNFEQAILNKLAIL